MVDKALCLTVSHRPSRVILFIIIPSGLYTAMARSRRSSRSRSSSRQKGPAFVPERIQAFAANRLVDGFGGAIALAGLAMIAALISYHPADPSMNTASAADEMLSGTQNWLGTPGAFMSDLFLQTLGIGSCVFALVLIALGARVIRRTPIRPLTLRFVFTILAALFTATAAARLPSGGWMTQDWLGGSGGVVLLNTLAGWLPGSSTGLGAHTIAALIAAVGALACLPLAMAVTKDEVIYVWDSLRYMAAWTTEKIVGAAHAFYDWVRHYSDPEYVAPQRERLTQLEAPKSRSRRARITADDDDVIDAEYEEEDEDDEEYEEDDEEEVDEEDEDSTPQLRAPVKAAKVVKPEKAKKKAPKPSTKQRQLALATADGEWELPSTDLLRELPDNLGDGQMDEATLQRNAELLQTVLQDFNVQGEIVSIHPGPVVTLYELEPAPGVKSSRVISLSDDIARSMSATSVRCAVIPGRNVIGIELPNRKRQTVFMREMLETSDVQDAKGALPLILGKDIGGQPIIADLARMPHLLVAGTTGSGKSVAVNTMILSLLYRLPPEKCRFIMIDPKMLELSVYDDIPHLLSPVVTEPGKAVVALKWTVKEMEDRYRAMSKLGVRNIEGYNERLREARKKGEVLTRRVQTGFDGDTGKPVFEEQPMDMNEIPYIVVVVDEFADLMLVAGKDVENAIQRLAQMARAAGIHLIMATQRPSVDVITGVIKANFPTRISFQVTSKIDSRTILGEGGAEQLLGMGDMLYMASGGRITRVHGPFVADDDVENVVTFIKSQAEPSYIDDVTEGGDFGDSEIMSAMFGEGGGGNDCDEFYDKAVALVARERKASTSFIQRHFQIGYNRAARIMEEMERQGVVSRASATGKREVLVGDYSDA